MSDDSFMSAITLLGNPSEMYLYGTQYAMIAVAYLTVTPIVIYIFLPVFHNMNVTSVYELLSLRFDNRTRQLGCVIFTIHMILYLPIVVYAPALAFNQFTGINTFVACGIIYIVCTMYTSLGGIKAVMWTDTFQVILMFLGMWAVAIRSTYRLQDGAAEVWRRAEESDRLELFNMDPHPKTRHTFWTMTVGGIFLWSSTYAANQAQIQRYLSVPTKKHAATALWINAVLLIILLITCCWCGLVVYATYYSCDPLTSKRITATDQLLPLLVMDTMHDIPGIAGLFAASIFSGALSTVSTGLSSLAAVTLKDFIGGWPCLMGFKVSGFREGLIIRIISVVYGVICMALVFLVANLGAVLQAALSIHGIVGGAILGMMTLTTCVPWVNSKGAFVAGLTALIFVSWMGFGAQYAAASGQVYFERKEISVDGCNCNITLGPQREPQTANFDLYAVSYMWYSLYGWCVTMVVAVVISACNWNNPRDVNPDLLSPPIKALLNRLPSKWQRRLRWTSDEDSKREVKMQESTKDQKTEIVDTVPKDEVIDGIDNLCMVSQRL